MFGIQAGLHTIGNAEGTNLSKYGLKWYFYSRMLILYSFNQAREANFQSIDKGSLF